MNTWSHALINSTVAHRLQRRGWPIPMSAVVVGSILPDVPLGVLTAAYLLRWRSDAARMQEIFGSAYDNLYFSDPLWVAATQALHAPPLIVLYALVGLAILRAGRFHVGGWVLWFALSCGLHSLVDIVTHAGDGPLLLFPFETTLRFVSPVSYWDRNHYAVPFGVFALLLDLTLIGYWVVVWWRGRQKRRATAGRA